MQFLNPIWLWGLTGLLIPIGIHLLSRKDGKIIKIGSVRHLEDTNTRQFKSLRLNEIMLLVMRCLLITFIVLLLSRFHFHTAEKKLKWLLIEKGLEHDVNFFELLSGQQTEFEIKSLATGFPDLKDSLAPKEKINYWKLIEDLKTRSLDQAVVLSYNYADGFSGKRAHLPDHIQWISKDPDAIEFPVHAIRHSGDSVSMRTGQSNAYETNFTKKYISTTPGQHFIKSGFDSIAIEALDSISITVVSDSAFEEDKKMVRVALDVLKQTKLAFLDVKAFTPGHAPKEPKTDWVFWLSEKPLAVYGSNSIRYLPTKSTAPNLFQREENHQKNASWILTKRLNEEIALENHLTGSLALILFPKEKYNNRARLFDKRVLPETNMWSKNQDENKKYKASVTTSSSEKLLAFLILLTLGIERLIAFKRNQ